METKTYRIQTPDGQIMSIEAPVGASQEDLFEFAQTQAGKTSAPPPITKGVPLKNAEQATTVYQQLVQKHGPDGAAQIMLMQHPEIMGGGSSPPQVQAPPPVQPQAPPAPPTAVDLATQAGQIPRVPTISQGAPKRSDGQRIMDFFGRYGNSALLNAGAPIAAGATAAASLPFLAPNEGLPGNTEGNTLGEAFKARYAGAMKDFKTSQKQMAEEEPNAALLADVGGELAFGSAAAKALVGTGGKIMATKKGKSAVDALKKLVGAEGKAIPNYVKIALPSAAGGAAEAYVRADQNKGQAAAMGGAVGAVAPAVVRAASKIPALLGGTGKFLAHPFGKSAEAWTPEQVTNKAEEIITNVGTRNGLEAMADVTGRQAPLDKNALAADYLGTRGAALLKQTGSDAAHILEDPALAQRAAQTANRVRERIVPVAEAQAARARYEGYEAARKQVGTELDDYLASPGAQIKGYSNQEDLADFLGSSKELRSVRTKARDWHRTDYQKDIPIDNTTARAVEDGGDEVITPAYAAKIKEVMQSKIDDTEKEFGRTSTESARWMKVKQDFDDLLVDGAPDKKHRAILEKYRDKSRISDAYKDGLDFRKTSEITLEKKLAEMTTKERIAFKNGATEALYNLGGEASGEAPDLLKAVNEVGAKNKLKMIYGEAKLKSIDETVKREGIYSGTATAALTGAQKGNAEVAKGWMSSLKSFGIPWLQERRAYSPTGLGFATADALLEALGTSKMDPRVRQEVARILMNSKTPAQALQNIETRQLGREANELAKRLRKRFAVTAASPAATSSVVRLFTPEEDQK